MKLYRTINSVSIELIAEFPDWTSMIAHARKLWEAGLTAMEYYGPGSHGYISYFTIYPDR